MAETINSIAFQDNHISWVQVELTGGQSLLIKRVTDSPLPFILNFDNIQKKTTALQIANQLKGMAEAHELSSENVRFLISTKFGFIRKVLVDHSIPESQYLPLVKNELNYVFTSPVDDFSVYMTDYVRDVNELKEILGVAIRKQVFGVIRDIALEAGFNLTAINLNCFSIDELFRRFFPNIIGQTLLINFTDRGFELIISDEKNFLNYFYKPYSKSLQSIEQLSSTEIIEVFLKVLEELQSTDFHNSPQYSISQIFLFGNNFNPELLNLLRERCELPLRILNPMESAEWQIISDDPRFESPVAHRFVESLSNVF